MPGVVAKGYLGVELFFTLSGFILCHVYLDSVADGGFRYFGFLWARLARIYPLHLATLAGVGVMALAAQAAGRTIEASVLSWSSLPANLLLVHAWGFAPVAGWNHPSWSISAEWFAYLTFPLFAWSALKTQDIGPGQRRWPGLRPGRDGDALCDLPAPGGLPADPRDDRLGGAANHSVLRHRLRRLTWLWRSGAVQGRRLASLGAVFSGAAILIAAQFGAPDALLVALFAAVLISESRLSDFSAAERTPRRRQAILVLSGGREISYSIYMVWHPVEAAFR